MSLGRNFSFETNHRKDFRISTKSNLMIIGNSSWHFGWPPACNLHACVAVSTNIPLISDVRKGQDPTRTTSNAISEQEITEAHHATGSQS